MAEGLVVVTLRDAITFVGDNAYIDATDGGHVLSRAFRKPTEMKGTD